MNILVCTEIKIHKITESLEVYFGFVSKKLRGISSIDYRLRSEKMAQSGTLLAGPLAAAHVGAKKQCYLRQWRLPPPPPPLLSPRRLSATSPPTTLAQRLANFRTTFILLLYQRLSKADATSGKNPAGDTCSVLGGGLLPGAPLRAETCLRQRLRSPVPPFAK